MQPAVTSCARCHTCKVFSHSCLFGADLPPDVKLGLQVNLISCFRDGDAWGPDWQAQPADVNLTATSYKQSVDTSKIKCSRSSLVGHMQRPTLTL